MDTDSHDPWTLVRFEELVDRWVQVERPPPDLVDALWGWIQTRAVDPYRGPKLRRMEDRPNSWFATIHTPGDGDGVVLCMYTVEEVDHVVRCDVIGCGDSLYIEDADRP
jgi:hypothetical protein